MEQDQLQAPGTVRAKFLRGIDCGLYFHVAVWRE